MTTQIQRRRGTTAQHSTFTGAEAELTVDTTKDTVVVHDGSTVGGRPLLREDQSNLPTTAPTTGIYNASGSLAISTGGSGRLFVDASGRVGIATSSPSTVAERLLHVYGSAGLSGGIRVTGNNGTGIDLIQAADGNGYLYQRDNAFLAVGTNNTERLRITSAGLVGVGTSSPSNLLEVSSASNSYIRSTTTTNSVSGIFGAYTSTVDVGSITNHSLNFYTAGINRATLDTSGRLGVGTTSPDTLFTCATSDNAVAARFKAANGIFRIYPFETGVGVKITALNGNESAFEHLAIQGASHSFVTGITERARIDSSGRLLVGTSSARSNFYNATSTASIQIEGTTSNTSSLSLVSNNTSTSFEEPSFVLGRSNGAAIGSNTVAANDTPLGRISFQGNDGTQFVEAASIRAFVDGASSGDDVPGRLVFSTTADGASSPTERVRITEKGAFKASNSGAYTGATAAYHEFYQTQNAVGLLVRATSGSLTSDVLVINGDRATTDATYNLLNAYNGAVSGQFIVRDSGNAVNTNNSYGSISDRKLKENIVDASSQWSDIKALQVRKYNFKEGQTHTQIGLVAQEVELVSPGLVSESPDRDTEGNDLGTVTKSVNYSVLYMKAVKALQEAMERIEQLEQRLTDAGIA